MSTPGTRHHRYPCNGAGVLAAAGSILLLAGCVVTHGSAEPSPSGSAGPAAAQGGRINPGSIEIVEGEPESRHYVVVGNVEASGRAFNLLSSNPTRADVDEALRAQAARLGADAVIDTRYRSERTGLMSRGKLSGAGLAVRFAD